MIVVSDTTPLNYLILVDSVHVLPGLFVRVYAPSAVITELSHSGAPEAVRVWAASPPEWLTVQDPTRTDASLKLGSGETAAIALGQELKTEAHVGQMVADRTPNSANTNDSVTRLTL